MHGDGGFPIGGIVVGSLTTTMTIFTLRYLFRFTGILTAEQATYYPLRVNKLRMDPWPLCWQESWTSTPNQML